MWQLKRPLLCQALTLAVSDSPTDRQARSLNYVELSHVNPLLHATLLHSIKPLGCIAMLSGLCCNPSTAGHAVPLHQAAVRQQARADRGQQDGCGAAGAAVGCVFPGRVALLSSKACLELCYSASSCGVDSLFILEHPAAVPTHDVLPPYLQPRTGHWLTRWRPRRARSPAAALCWGPMMPRPHWCVCWHVCCTAVPAARQC